MTRQELDAIWQRYMHRNDLSNDLDEVYRAATQRITTHVTVKDIDMNEVLAVFPSLLISAGMLYLHRLSQDDIGMQREAEQFEIERGGYAMFKAVQQRENATPLIGGNFSAP